MNQLLANWLPSMFRIALTLSEEEYPGAVTSHIEIVLQTFAVLNTQLGQIVSTIVPEQYQSARLQVLVAIPNDLLHPNRQ